MGGVYLKVGEDGGCAVSTDGHRLVRIEEEALRSKSSVAVTLPQKMITLLGRTLEGEQCEIRTDGSLIEVAFGNTRIGARLIDEDYPQYETIIPRGNHKLLTIERESLKAAAQRITLYSSPVNHSLRIDIENDELKISGQNLERSTEGVEKIPCSYEGERFSIAFNGAYLQEVLKAIGSQEIVFEMGSREQASILKPATQQEGENLMMLLMPVILSEYA